MIGAALRSEIDRYAVHMRRKNPLFTKAEAGVLTPHCIGRYLANVHYLVSHTTVFLTRARDRALDNGDSALAAHYAHKIVDEAGHDLWAKRDLQRVAAMTAQPVSPDVLQPIRDVLDYLFSVIERDPTLFLSYQLLGEYITVALGTTWLDLLEEHCGIPRTSMTIIGNHVALDQDHLEDLLEQIDDLVGDPKKLAPMREVLLTAIGHIERFCVEVTEECPHACDADRAASKQVSAA